MPRARGPHGHAQPGFSQEKHEPDHDHCRENEGGQTEKGVVYAGAEGNRLREKVGKLYEPRFVSPDVPDQPVEEEHESVGENEGVYDRAGADRGDQEPFNDQADDADDHRRDEEGQKEVHPGGHQGVSEIGSQGVEGPVGQVHHPAQAVNDVQADGHNEKHPAQDDAVQDDVHTRADGTMHASPSS
jgi:hypothetical protein